MCANDTRQIGGDLHAINPSTNAHVEEARMEAPEKFEINLRRLWWQAVIAANFADHWLEDPLVEQRDIPFVEGWVIERGEHE